MVEQAVTRAGVISRSALLFNPVCRRVTFAGLVSGNQAQVLGRLRVRHIDVSLRHHSASGPSRAANSVREMITARCGPLAFALAGFSLVFRFPRVIKKKKTQEQKKKKSFAFCHFARLLPVLPDGGG